MNEKWTTNMKQRMEGHKMSPPAGLWEGISSEMGLQKESGFKTVAIKRWYWVAAAVVIVLVGFFAVYQFNQSESLPQVVQATHSSQNSQEPNASVVNNGVRPESHQLALADVPQHPKAKVTPKIPVEENQPIPVETNEVISQDTLPQHVSKEETPQQTSVVISRHARSETDHHHVANYQTKQVNTSMSESRWSVGLNASGGLLASSEQNRVGWLYHSDYTSDIGMNGVNLQEGNYSTFQPSYTQTSFVSKHHIPVCLGLSLHYQLNPRLALLSGINYTYLYSEFSILQLESQGVAPNPLYLNSHNSQKLHYLGIPVGLSYQLWKYKAFSLYFSGFAMLEKCLNEKPWQWSLSGAVGAEYAINSLLGVYLEPSLGYYFNDGTSFEHYYKEHPLAPSIEFGLRLHLSGK